MPQIRKPMLAGNYDEAKAKFPYVASPKIDGIRFLMVNGVAVSRTFKPIRNNYIQRVLSENLTDGVDGEITVGDTFQSSSSGVMSIEGEPDFKAWLFDYVDPEREEILPFQLRLKEIPGAIFNIPFDYEILYGTLINSIKDLERYEYICLNKGYEGVMLRDPFGTYKFGRSTVRDNILLKVKRFLDDEAVLIDIEEKMHNENEAQKDAFGRTKRSSSIAGLVGANTAGTLIVKNKEGQVFGVGSGLNDLMRNEIWNNKNEYLGKLVKYKYFPQGVKDLPRHPVFLGFRDSDDL
jgi:DNA ligase-1